MEHKHIMKYSVILMNMVVLLAGVSVYAADDSAALKKEIRRLQNRITELEQQVSARANPAPAVSPGYPAEPSVNNWDILQEMEWMRRQMNQLFTDNTARSWGAHASPEPWNESFFSPRVDIQQDAGSYVIKMDIPDMDKEKINLEVQDNILIVSGERNKINNENKSGQFFRQERSYGYFSRAIPLPENAKTDAVSAEYKRGVLIVTIPKKAAAEKEPTAQKIQVL